MKLRENIRIILLVLLILGSVVGLFAPGIGLGASAESNQGATNLQYGIDLAGGTQIRAPLVGVTAEGLNISDGDALEERVADQLSTVEAGSVTARRAQDGDTVEVTANITTTEFRTALDAAGVEYDSVRTGVSAETRQQTIRVLRDKLSSGGFSRGSVTELRSATGGYLVKVEVPGKDRQEVIDLVKDRGTVSVQAYHAVQRNNSTVYVNRTVLEGQSDFQSVGIARRAERGQGPRVPVTIADGVASEFQQDMVETGVAKRRSTTCGYPDGDGPCLLTIVDGEVVYSAGMDEDLGTSMVEGSWEKDPQFVLSTTNYSEARELSINLRAGALPAKLDVNEGTSTYVSASSGDNFKRYSLATGLLAVFAVSVVVFLRYSSVRVAAPMVVTALSEVVILMGFAAVVNYPIDLSVIAGFIAVVGTGVDDLIIIADEVMVDGGVDSARVFSSRFKKAFWVIVAAAATTMIAMAPLAVGLSLGDLQGFAIFTILGVLVGIGVTRPAYGDVLRRLVTE